MIGERGVAVAELPRQSGVEKTGQKPEENHERDGRGDKYPSKHQKETVGNRQWMVANPTLR